MPTQSPVLSAGGSEQRLDISKSIFSCGYAQKAKSGASRYHYQLVRIPVSGDVGDLAAGSVKVQMIYTTRGETTPELTVTCTIPNTARAKAVLEQKLVKPEAHKHQQAAESGSGARTALVPSGRRNDQLEPVVVIERWTYDWGEFLIGQRTREGYAIGPYDASHGDVWGGGGGGYDPMLDPEASGNSCNPAVTPECEQALKDSDRTNIAAALAAKVRDPNGLEEPAKSACAAMISKVNEMMASNIKRGIVDTHDGPLNDGLPPHYGAYNETTGNIHVDPTWLDALSADNSAVQREVANTLLHEAAHAMGYDNTNGYFPMTTSTFSTTVYGDAPFSYLSPGTNSCLNWTS